MTQHTYLMLLFWEQARSANFGMTRGGSRPVDEDLANLDAFAACPQCILH